jgi:hypothetical protein
MSIKLWSCVPVNYFDHYVLLQQNFIPSKSNQEISRRSSFYQMRERGELFLPSLRTMGVELYGADIAKGIEAHLPTGDLRNSVAVSETIRHEVPASQDLASAANIQLGPLHHIQRGATSASSGQVKASRAFSSHGDWSSNSVKYVKLQKPRAREIAAHHLSLFPTAFLVADCD